MENYPTDYQKDQQATELSVRPVNVLRQIPRMIVVCLVSLPFVYSLFCVMVAGFIAIGSLLSGAFDSFWIYSMFLVWSILWTALWFALMRVLLVPTGGILRCGQLERVLQTTSDRHQAVHLMVKLAALNDRLRRRVIARYYRQSTAALAEQAIGKPLVSIPKADLFMASEYGNGGLVRFLSPSYGWLTLTSYYLAHETDKLCFEDARIVIRLEDIRRIEVNAQRFPRPFMMVEFDCAGELSQIRLTPGTRLDLYPPWRWSKKLALWKSWIEEAIELRKKAAEQHKTATLAIRMTDECSE